VSLLRSRGLNACFGSRLLALRRSWGYNSRIWIQNTGAPTELGIRFVHLDPDTCRSYGAQNSIIAFGSIHLPLLRSWTSVAPTEPGIKCVLRFQTACAPTELGIQFVHMVPDCYRSYGAVNTIRTSGSRRLALLRSSEFNNCVWFYTPAAPTELDELALLWSWGSKSCIRVYTTTAPTEVGIQFVHMVPDC